jgi:hypothetical protein
MRNKHIEDRIMFGLGMVAGLLVWAGLASCAGLSVEAWTIPRFKGSYDLRGFTGIALDRRTGRLNLTNDTGWCEIPYRNGQPTTQGAFMAPTKGYQLRAVAATPSGVLVYDVLSHSLMGDAGQHRLSQPISHPTGMTAFLNKICIADGRKNKLYVVQLSGQQAHIVQTQSMPAGVVGLAADRGSLYAATHRNIYQYNQNFDLIAQYQLSVSINGLTTGPQGELIAVARGTNSIYLLRGISP